MDGTKAVQFGLEKGERGKETHLALLDLSGHPIHWPRQLVHVPSARLRLLTHRSPARTVCDFAPSRPPLHAATPEDLVRLRPP